MSEVILGNKLTATTGSAFTISNSTSNQQALILVTADQPLFIHRLGLRARRTGSVNGNTQLAIWAYDSATQLPGELLGYTSGLTVGSTEQTLEAALVWSKNDAALGVVGSAVRIASGQKFFLGLQNDNAPIEISITLTTINTTTYRRQVSGNPSNPFGSPTTGSFPDIASVYAVAETNTEPTLTLTGPAANISTTIPALTATFSDANSGTPYHDRMQKYEISVKDATDTIIWNIETTANANERSSASFSKLYNGPTLVQGTYAWQARAMDDTGVYGPFTAWRTSVISDLGVVDVAPATPTGKLELGVVTNFTARWVHPLSVNANAAWIRILSGLDVVRQTPSIVTLSPTVATNGTITLTSAQAAVATSGNPLPPGTYSWQMQARDINGNLSSWSTSVPLIVNNPPNQPSGLRPASGVTVSDRPLLDWLVTDPDADDVLGVGLVSQIEITKPDTTTLTWQTSNVDPVSGRGYFQLTTTEALNNGVYQWRVRGRDTSAVGTANEFGPWSAPALFTLITAPKIAITTPAQNASVATSTPQIQWTVTDGLMSFYQVRFYRTGQVTSFFSTEQVTVPVPSGSGIYSPPANWLKNGISYDVEVTISTSGGITSTSARRTFRVSYNDADLVQNASASVFQNPRDVEPTSVALTWSPTQYPQTQFRGYVIWRRGSLEDPDLAVPIALIRSPGQTGFIDHNPPPNRALIYGISQLRRSGTADTQVSPISEVPVEVSLTTPVLASLLDGSKLRGALKYLAEDLSGGFSRRDASVVTWGSKGKPIWIRAPRGHGARSFKAGYTILNDERGTLEEHWTDVRNMVESGDPFCIRTEQERAFVRIVPSKDYWRRGRVVGRVEINLQLEEIYWNEVVDINV
jgi:hypothetical protein